MVDERWYVRLPGSPAHTSAGGVVARLVDGRVCVALVGEEEFELSFYILPKGRLEEGESMEQAARREIEEEAGLADLKLLGKLGVCERYNYARTFWKTTHYFLFVTGQAGGKPSDREHRYRARWFPIDELPTMLWPEQKGLIEDNRDRIVDAVQQDAAGG